MAPIKTLPITAERAYAVSRVVAFTGCTRGVAAAYLDAACGDVPVACEGWRVDHRHFEMPAFASWAPVSMEASD